MSPRAACRLAELGFEEVYDYSAGKVDRLARGLPTEAPHRPRRAGDAAHSDVPTCSADELIADVRPRVDRSPHGFALVLSQGGVLLGRLRRAALAGPQDAAAGDVMEPGPSTVRANEPLDELLDGLRERGLTTAVVTDPDGRLIGIVTS